MDRMLACAERVTRHEPLKDKKSPVACATGPICGPRERAGALTISFPQGPLSLLTNVLPPVHGMRPTPRILRPIKPISRPDEIVGRGEIVGRVRNDKTPSVGARTRLQGSHQSQLQFVTAMLLENADAAKIACIFDMCRRDQSSKGNGQPPAVSEPPMPPVKLRKGCALKKCQLVQLRESVGNVVIISVDFAYAIHRDLPFSVGYRIGGSYLASMILRPSQIAPINPVTMTAITALKVKLCACSTLLRQRLKCCRSARNSRRSPSSMPKDIKVVAMALNTMASMSSR